MKQPSNLPPGVTDAMLEDQIGDPVDFDEYVRLRWAAGQPESRPGHPVPYNLVSAMGLAGETGEVMELLKKHYRDGKDPGEDLLLECGDVLHYLTVILHAYGWTLDDAASANITKLAKRDEKKRRDAMSLAELREAGLL